MFCGDRPLAAWLRPGNSDGARHAWAIPALLVKRLRRAWPDVKIVFRGDGGFCRPRILSWCERNRVDYIVGIARNAALAKKAESIMEPAATGHEANGKKVRVFDEFPYAARSWRRRSRRVIVKVEHAGRGANPRYIVTSPDGAPQWLYDRVYCARGDMENRIKEQQLDLFADRTSCHAWWPNQYRLPLSTLAYVLLEAIRRVALASGELANAYVGTIRGRVRPQSADRSRAREKPPENRGPVSGSRIGQSGFRPGGTIKPEQVSKIADSGRINPLMQYPG